MGKVAIVTGSTRGIGEAIALSLAEQGYNITITHISDSSKIRAEEIIKKIEGFGSKAIAVQGDVSDYAVCKKIVDETVKTFGNRIDVLINNAGIEKSGDFLKKTPEEYSHIVAVNLLSPMHMSHLVLPYMFEAKSGVVINLGSIASYMALSDDIDYAASKSGILGLTRSLSMLSAPYNVRVNGVAPGLIETDMLKNAPEEAKEQIIESVPLGRLGVIEDIVACAEYLINAPYVTGQVISPNGGLVMD